MSIPGGSILGVARMVITDIDLEPGDVVYLNASGHVVKKLNVGARKLDGGVSPAYLVDLLSLKPSEGDV